MHNCSVTTFYPGNLLHFFSNQNYLELDYKKGKTKINLKGNYSFNDKFDRYEINIINKKNKYDFESLINLKNNSIIIEEIDYLYSLLNLY